MTLVNSSNLAAVDYAAGMLTVAFRSGAVYVYWGVPLGVYHGLMSAQSHGSYFHRHIRTSYPYQRIL